MKREFYKGDTIKVKGSNVHGYVHRVVKCIQHDGRVIYKVSVCESQEKMRFYLKRKNKKKALVKMQWHQDKFIASRILLLEK